MEAIIANYYYKNDLPDNLKLLGDIAVDTEAMGLNNLRDRLCVVQVSSGDGNAHVVHFPNKVYKCPNLKKLLSRPKTQYIFHFARFDVAILQHYLEIEFDTNIYCTKIASRLSRTYTDQHSLKELCSELASVKISKQQQSSNWGAKDLSKDQINYAASDVLHLHIIRQKLEEMLKSAGRSNIAKKCMDFIPTRATLDLLGWNDLDIFHH